MTSPDLGGRCILVVEDDYFLAQDISSEVRMHGGKVLGPVPSVSKALALLHREPHPDGAILDIRLGKDKVYPLADELTSLGIRYIFATAEHESSVPNQYAAVSIFRKPIDLVEAAATLFPQAS